MLEALVSSRIRRALFEHILAHPQERFYLRGLAKQLQVSISPLRRELKRLEQTGVLAADEEGNMRFYTVHTTSQVFLQLQHASEQAVAPSPATAAALEHPGSGPVAIAQRSEPAALHPKALPVGILSAGPEPSPRFTASPLMVGLAVAVALLAIGLGYLWTANRQLVAKGLESLKADVMVIPAASSSGAMRGARWQVVPGGFGGFSAGANSEAF